MGDLRSKLPDGLQGEVISGKIWSEDCGVYNHPLIGWLANRVVFKDYCA